MSEAVEEVPSKALAALPVVGTQFCDFQPVDLTLSQSGIFSCGRYTVQNGNGEQIFAVDGNFGCGRQRRIMDPSGKAVLILHKQAFNLHCKWIACLEDGIPLFDVKKPCFQLKFSLDVYLGGKQSPDFRVSGCCLKGKYSINRIDTGELIAKAKCKWSLASLVRCNTYTIQVEPGVDIAFVVSLFLVMNEIFLDRPVGGGG